MANEFKVKNGLQINSTQPVIGIVNSSSFTNDSSNLATINAIKNYAESNYTVKSIFDVSIISVSEGDLLVYTSGKWKNTAPINASDYFYDKTYIDASLTRITNRLNTTDVSLSTLLARHNATESSLGNLSQTKFDASISGLTTRVGSVEGSLGNLTSVKFDASLVNTYTRINASDNAIWVKLGNVDTSLNLMKSKVDADTSLNLMKSTVDADASLRLMATRITRDTCDNAIWVKLGNVDTSLNLMKSKVDADTSLNLMKSKVDSDTSLNLFTSRVTFDASLVKIYSSVVKEASLGTDFFWAAGLLEVSVAGGSGVSQAYVDGSLASRDASINEIWLNSVDVSTTFAAYATNASVNTALKSYVSNASLGTDFFWAAGFLEVSVAGGSGVSQAVFDSSIGYLTTRLNTTDVSLSTLLARHNATESSLGNLSQTKFDASLSSLTTRVGSVEGSIGYLKGRLDITDVSLSTLKARHDKTEASLGNLSQTKFDASLVNIATINTNQDTSIAWLNTNKAPNASLGLYVLKTGDTMSGALGIFTSPDYSLDVSGYARSKLFYVSEIGRTQYLLNSAGSWGTIQNDEANKFSLGINVGLNASLGVPVLTWTNVNTVGINNSSPVYSLDVSGNLRSSGTTRIDGSLYVDNSIFINGGITTSKLTINQRAFDDFKVYFSSATNFLRGGQGFYRSGGSLEAPVSSSSGFWLGQLSFNGYNNTWQNILEIIPVQSSAWSDGNADSEINFYYKNVGSADSNILGQKFYSNGDLYTRRRLSIGRENFIYALDVSGTVFIDGSLNMNYQRIINLGIPVNSSDATNKYYVDASLNLKYDKVGGLISGDVSITGILKVRDVCISNSLTIDGTTSFSSSYLYVQGAVSFDGSLNMNNRQIFNLGYPTNASDATNKTYVDSSLRIRLKESSLNMDLFKWNAGLLEPSVTGGTGVSQSLFDSSISGLTTRIGSVEGSLGNLTGVKFDASLVNVYTRINASDNAIWVKLGNVDTSLNLMKSIVDADTSLNLMVSKVVFDASLVKIYSSVVKEASLGTDFFWAAGLLEVSVAGGSGVSQAYVDGSLAQRDSSLNNAARIDTYVNSSSYYDGSLNLRIKEASLNMDLFKWNAGLLEPSTSGTGDVTKVYVDGSLAQRDASLNNAARIDTYVNSSSYYDGSLNLRLREASLNMDVFKWNAGLLEPSIASGGVSQAVFDSSIGYLTTRLNTTDVSLSTLFSRYNATETSLGNLSQIKFDASILGLTTRVGSTEGSIGYLKGRLDITDISVSSLYSNARIDASFATKLSVDSSVGALITRLNTTDSSVSKMYSNSYIDASFAIKSGFQKISASTNAPLNPGVYDLWIDTSI
jgi:hypothetical protein